MVQVIGDSQPGAHAQRRADSESLVNDRVTLRTRLLQNSRNSHSSLLYSVSTTICLLNFVRSPEDCGCACRPLVDPAFATSFFTSTTRPTATFPSITRDDFPHLHTAVTIAFLQRQQRLLRHHHARCTAKITEPSSAPTQPVWQQSTHCVAGRVASRIV
jgi:hypothetical protein